MNHFHKFVVVAVVHRHTDDNGALHLQSLLKGRRSLVRRINIQPLSAEGLRESDYINWTKLGAGSSPIFRDLLKGDHVVSRRRVSKQEVSCLMSGHSSSVPAASGANRVITANGVKTSSPTSRTEPSHRT